MSVCASINAINRNETQQQYEQKRIINHTTIIMMRTIISSLSNAAGSTCRTCIKRSLPSLASRIQDIVHIGSRRAYTRSSRVSQTPPPQPQVSTVSNDDCLDSQQHCRYPQQHYFDDSYKERVVLNDGTSAVLRLVRPSDHDMWVDGFSRLSTKSRYNRFCAAKKALSEKDIRYFTVIDGEDHFAIVAVREGKEMDREVGLGVARFIRSNTNPTHAEPAITVTDDAQSHGLGTLLALRLAAAARERNIDYFDSNVLGSNTKIIRLVKDLSPSSTFRRYGIDTLVTTKLPDFDPQSSWSDLHAVTQRQFCKETNLSL